MCETIVRAFGNFVHPNRVPNAIQQVGKVTQKIYRFPNGYSASVVNGFGEKGYGDNFFDCAVINANDDIDYSVSVFNGSKGVSGIYNSADILGFIDAIARLPRA